MSQTKTKELEHARFAAAEIETRQKTGERRVEDETSAPVNEAAEASPHPLAHPRRRWVLPFIVTAFAVAVAGGLGKQMWDAYMGAPWTRDGTVRAYVATLAPEVSGRIVDLPVADNQFVHKGVLLMVIDPTDYRIAVSLAQAAVRQAEASVRNGEAQMAVQNAQIDANQAQLDQARAALVFAKQQDSRYQDLAQKGYGSVQNAQQFASGLYQQQAQKSLLRFIFRM